MKQLAFYIALITTLLVGTVCTAQSNLKTLTKDFERLEGSWQGTLTYLDYSSGKSYTMPSEITITRIYKTNKYIFSSIYPNETNANSVDTITVSTDGKYIDKELVKSRRKLPDGNTEIITEESGTDGNDNKSATFRHTYIFGTTTYTIRKDVQFTGSAEWINRYKYAYSKNPSR